MVAKVEVIAKERDDMATWVEAVLRDQEATTARVEVVLKEQNALVRQVEVASKERDALVTNLTQLEVDLNELEKVKFGNASRVVSLKDECRGLNTKLSVVEGDKIQVEKSLAEVKNLLNDSDRQFLQ